jgi:alanyl-tRNA synthetase
MQQHSGQHVLSQCFVELLGGETRSFHLGEQSTTLEIGLAEAAEADIERVERRANEIVFEDREIKTYFVAAGEISTVPLRRPPKKEGTIRVVEVSGFDFSACGGTHCRRTGEIGLIKVVRWDKIRNNLRFEFLCGWRAWQDYRDKNRSILEISQKFSAHEKDAAAAVEKTVEENKLTRKKLKRLQETLAGFEAREMVEKEPGRLIKRRWADRTPEDVKLLALNIIRLAPRVVLFAVRGGDKDSFIFACSEKMALDMRELLPLTLGLTRGKGGGGPSLVEIVADRVPDLDGVLAAAAEFLRPKIEAPARG